MQRSRLPGLRCSAARAAPDSSLFVPQPLPNVACACGSMPRALLAVNSAYGQLLCVRVLTWPAMHPTHDLYSICHVSCQHSSSTRRAAAAGVAAAVAAAARARIARPSLPAPSPHKQSYGRSRARRVSSCCPAAQLCRACGDRTASRGQIKLLCGSWNEAKEKGLGNTALGFTAPAMASLLASPQAAGAAAHPGMRPRRLRAAPVQPRVRTSRCRAARRRRQPARCLARRPPP